MVLVSGSGDVARVLRIKGNPANVSSLGGEKVCDWKFPYNGIVQASSDKLYFMSYYSAGSVYKMNFDITNRNNYVNKTFTFSDAS